MLDQTIRVNGRVYTRQALEAMPREARMAIFNDQYYYTFSTGTTVTNNILYNGWTDPLTYSVPKVWKSPVLQQQLVEGAPIPEPDMAWLKRRVNETCWVPA